MRTRLPGAHDLPALMRLVVGIAVLAAGSWYALAPAPRDALRAADRLWMDGRYYEATRQYQALAASHPGWPELTLRLGAAAALRGEARSAEVALRRALAAPQAPADQRMTVLLLGRQLEIRGQPHAADTLWSQLAPGDPLYGPRLMLQAERALRAHDYAHATRMLNAARAAGLPPDWAVLADERRAALQAPTDPAAARAVLSARDEPPAGEASPWLRAVRPAPLPGAAGLRAALDAPAPHRPMLLARALLTAGLPDLAALALAPVATPADSPALAYYGVARWSAGDRAGLDDLQAAASAVIPDPTVLALVVTVALAADDQARAEAALQVLTATAPDHAATQLAQAQWQIAQRDYLAAAAALQRATRAAPASERGAFLLAAARIHVALGLDVCGAARRYAVEAADAPATTEAATLLAGVQLRCGDAAAARVAASQALAAHPDSAEASYYLGAAAFQLGDRATAYGALVRAADLAPASPWRAQAAEILARIDNAHDVMP